MTDWTTWTAFDGDCSTGLICDNATITLDTYYIDPPQWKAQASERKKYFPIWHLMESYKH